MERPISKHTHFISGASRSHDLIYLIAKDRGLTDQDVAHTRFIAFYQLKFGHMGDRNWNAVALCVAKKPEEKLIAVGESGHVFTYVGGTATDEVIEPSPVALTAVGVIEGFPYACGMNRQVYKRLDENKWVAMHAPSPEHNTITGFQGIAGFSENEIYAVGWKGEIWNWNGSEWINCTSPSDVILTGICCADDGKVYICGQRGQIICGRGDSWKMIDLEYMSEDFWDVIWFENTLYVATMTMLYRLIDNDLVPVDFGSDIPGTFYLLTQSEGVLWSVGSSDVFSFDGEHWIRVD